MMREPDHTRSIAYEKAKQHLSEAEQLLPDDAVWHVTRALWATLDALEQLDAALHAERNP